MGNAAHRRRMNETHNRPTFLVRSTLGSTSGGAGRFGGTSEPANLTEGVYFVEWLLPKSFEFLASPGGKLDFLSSGTSEPIDKKD